MGSDGFTCTPRLFDCPIRPSHLTNGNLPCCTRNPATRQVLRRRYLQAMWRPKTADELKARLKAGDLEETQFFDAKREPGPDNARTAVDLCAMTVAGGVIMYGADENSSGTRITEATPFPLSGARERISQ